MKLPRPALLIICATLLFWLIIQSLMSSLILGIIFGLIGEWFFRTYRDEKSPNNNFLASKTKYESYQPPKEGDVWGVATDNEGSAGPMPVFPKNSGTSHGSANWENPELIPLIVNDNIANAFDGAGYYIGPRCEVRPLMHGVCVAGSGQGKGVCLILPNLLRIPFSSWFVLDPKGENAAVSARWQKQQGQKVVLLDPWNEQKRLDATHGIEAMGFNPLAFVKANPDELPESCGVIAEMLVPDAPNSKDQYWNSRARSLIKTYLLHLITDRPETEHHLGTLYRWLRLSVHDRQRLWFEMEENSACDELVQSGIGEFSSLSTDSGPLPSIISTAQDSTGFLESVALRKSLENNDFDPYELTNGKTTVYLCLPERFLNSHARWLRLVIGVCLKACNYRPGKRVNFLLDEFAILGKMPDIERAFAFARGQNISVWIFVQSLTQLIEVYGEHGASAFLANARLRQFFGIFDLHTQKYLAEYLGEATIDTITKSQTFTTGNSTGSSEGWSFGSTITNGSNKGTSEGQSWSQSISTNYQQISRKLITNEEVGKLHDIITLIDGHKFLISRLAFWDSYYEAFKQGRFKYYPLTKGDWKRFNDLLYTKDIEERQSGYNFKDLGATFLPRADGQLKTIDNSQKSLLK